jgi:hypothetical protein
MSAAAGCEAAPLSFRRIVDMPFEACMAAFETWQYTAPDGGLHVGRSLLRGPIERDRDSGSCRIEVRLAGDGCARCCA